MSGSLVDRWVALRGELSLALALSKPYVVRLLDALSKVGEVHVSELSRLSRGKHSLVVATLELLEGLGLAEVRKYGNVKMARFMPRELRIVYRRGRGVKVEVEP